MDENGSHWVYFLASRKNGTIYTGMTNDLAARGYQHRTGVHDGFTNRYNVRRLVRCEPYATRQEAYRREQRVKRWRRAWKIELIESDNPEWRDLWPNING